MPNSLGSKYLDRRVFLVSATGAAVGLVLAASGKARAATDEEVSKAIADLVGNAEAESGEGILSLDVPQIAENGGTVPIGVKAESPMSEDDHVTAIHIVATGNPNPDVVSLRFTPRSGRAEASTRMRLAGTQDVIALAETSTGKLYRTDAEIKVTIGGCGG